MMIGIVGKSGSGKTHFSNLLNKNDEFTVIHVDEVVHEILGEEKFLIAFINKYGIGFINEKKIDRKKLGRYLFSSSEAMNEYNLFIWPFIEEKIDDIIARSKKPIIIDWMQLPIAKYFERCEKRILIKAPQDVRMERVGKRDQVSKEYREKREKFMLEYEESQYDEVIINDGTNLSDYADNIVRQVLTIGFYAGSFDPFTNGHLEIIKKASYLFDKIIVGIGKNPDKKRHYPEEKMREAISYSLKRIGINAEVIIYSGYTFTEAKKYHASAFIRGLRDQTDYQYEEEIATYNEEHSGIDTIYLRAGKVGNISSTLVRKKLEKGEEIEDLVPEEVYQYIKKRSY